jgi:Holliday junction resolvase RusA-like endonuclease
MPEKIVCAEARLAAPVQAQVTFMVVDDRRRDTDNFLAMLKPCFDAFVEVGVLEDDSHDKLKIAEPKWERGPEKKVIVELSPYRNGGE